MKDKFRAGRRCAGRRRRRCATAHHPSALSASLSTSRGISTMDSPAGVFLGFPVNAIALNGDRTAISGEDSGTVVATAVAASDTGEMQGLTHMAGPAFPLYART